MFNFDTVLLGLGMLVIGGIGRAEGAVVGTFVVVLFDKFLITLGPLRLILIGLIMLFVSLYLRNGLFGIKAQFRNWRDKKKSERRSTRAEKGGEMLPEEATETHDKDIVYMRRFDKMQRDYLKTLVSLRLLTEHQSISARPTQRGASAASHLFSRATASRQVCDHVRRAKQGLSHRRAVRTSGGAAASGRRQSLSHSKRCFPRRVRAPCAGSAES